MVDGDELTCYACVSVAREGARVIVAGIIFVLLTIVELFTVVIAEKQLRHDIL